MGVFTKCRYSKQCFLKYYVLGRRTHFLINGIVTVTNKQISLQIALGGILVHLFKADVKRTVFPSLFITADLNGTVVVIIKADLKGIVVHIVIYCYASSFFQLIKSSRSRGGWLYEALIGVEVNGCV